MAQAVVSESMPAAEVVEFLRHRPRPFALGGGYRLGMGVASLSYSSLEPSTAGRFGAGWVSNLSQYLTFESGFVVWHRADGGRVPRHETRSLEKGMKSRILFLIVPAEPFIDRQNKDIPAKHTVG